ncbi:MAG: hypothetical protein VW543_17515, partial [Deltaproteobacteria bacterium]
IHKDFFGEDDWGRKMIFLSEAVGNCREFKYSPIVYDQQFERCLGLPNLIRHTKPQMVLCHHHDPPFFIPH